MSTDESIFRHLDVSLRPDPKRTVVRPFSPDYPQQFADPVHPRMQRIAQRVLDLSDDVLNAELNGVKQSLDERHRDVEAMLDRRFDSVTKLLDRPGRYSDRQRLLVGAYLSEEFSFEAAALFNPSIVPAPIQSDVDGDDLRVVISLRGIGEGHVSSVTFRTGTWAADGTLALDKASETAVPPLIENFTDDPQAVIKLDCSDSREVSETVLFPVLPRQRQGIEDLRLVRFVREDGEVRYYGTYTAFSGADARPELLISTDFTSFEMHPLAGNAAGAKGMALFPRKIGGQYVMLGRQDSESIWLHRSDELCRWEGGGKLISPRYPWEFVQMGNCGSPIEIDEGWLVITHGVGTVRNYCMGAALLDKDDPSKVLARTPRPLLEPTPEERDGYVPNVVYSCGALVHRDTLLLPYGVADNFAAFVTAPVKDVLAAME